MCAKVSKCRDDRRMKVTYEFYSEEDEHKLNLIKHMDQMYSALHEIYDLTRNKLKYGEEELSDDVDKLLEQIKSIAALVHTMDEL